MQKQANALHALTKKLENLENEDKRIREAEHDKMILRYNNVKKELETQQSIERVRLEKMIKTATLAGGKSTSSQQFYSSKGFNSASP